MADKTVTKQTSTPKDLKITLSTSMSSSPDVPSVATFAAEWTRVSTDHNGGQEVTQQSSGADNEPNWFGSGAPSRKKVSNNKTATSATIVQIQLGPTSYYYPKGGDVFLKWLHVEVSGKRKDWAEEKTDKNKKKYKVHHKYLWSGVAARTIQILPPPEPDFNDIADGPTTFSKVFSWSVPQSSVWTDGIDKKDTTKRNAPKKGKKKGKIKKITYSNDAELAEIFYDLEWQTICNDNIANPDFNEAIEANWNPSAPGWDTGTTGPGLLTGSRTVTEQSSSWTQNYSVTRHFRIRSRGPAGPSDWIYFEHTYGNPLPPDRPANVVVDDTGNVTVTNTQTYSTNIGMKNVTLQYLTDVPDTSINEIGGIHKITVSPPASGTWHDVAKSPTDISLTFPTEPPANDKLTWARKVIVNMDDGMSVGPAAMASKIGGSYPLLTPPSNITVTDIQTSQKRMTVSATNNSAVAASYLLVFGKNNKREHSERHLGVIPHNETGGITVQIPDEWDLGDTAIGVKALLADYTYDANNYVTVLVNTGNEQHYYMESGIVWDTDMLPSSPTNVRATLTDTPGTVLVEWDWNWLDADIAEISWATNLEAWESTSQPQTYAISNTHAGRWYISDLAAGKWYIKVRLGKNGGNGDNNTTWGLYSEPYSITVASTPTRPYLMLTPKIITPAEMVRATWSYSSEDGSDMKEAYIADANDLTNRIIVKGTSKILSQSDFGWENGDEVSLRVCTVSAEGKPSEWSAVTNDSKIRVAQRPAVPSVEYISGWNPSKPITVGGTTTNEKCVVSLPFSFQITNVAAGDDITVRIQRSIGTIISTPSETDYPVYAKDNVYINTNVDSTRIVTINREDLTLGSLDDNAYYHLIVTTSDEYGQTPIRGYDQEFRVSWDHKAVEPDLEIDVDDDNDVAFIKLIKPTGSNYAVGDVCDVYRLSVDKPVAIIEDGVLGETYVDEYPTIGEFGGYLGVYRTFNGDTRTETNYAYSYYEGEEYSLSGFKSIIEFGGDSVTLYYDLSLSNSWKKDFVETKYLGGAVQGDWNPAVSRTGSIKAKVSIQEDPLSPDDPTKAIEAMRRLAVYSGVCVVRTPDGSNYYANVDVQEDREEKFVTRLATFSLNITRVDPPAAKYVMRTKSAWEEDQQEQEDEE